MTIYNFGLKSLNLKPLSEHLLLEVDGEKLPLAAYDSNFDEPINGILQGLVFFPKVTSKAFTVILSGVYPREMRFSFDSTALLAEEVKEKKEAVETSIQPETIVEDSLTMEEIIVELPVSEEIKDAQKELPPNEESDDSLDEPSSFEDATKHPEEPVILPPGPDPLLQVQKNSTKSLSLIHISSAHSSEFDPGTPNPVIHLLEEQKDISKIGGSMRLGSYPCEIKTNTLAYKAYGLSTVYERHRHRWEFNNDYRNRLEKEGLIVSGVCLDGNLVEIVELKDHPWFVGVQFHPEFKSRPTRPHPLFASFIEAAIRHSQG